MRNDPSEVDLQRHVLEVVAQLRQIDRDVEHRGFTTPDDLRQTVRLGREVLAAVTLAEHLGYHSFPAREFEAASAALRNVEAPRPTGGASS